MLGELRNFFLSYLMSICAYCGLVVPGNDFFVHALESDACQRIPVGLREMFRRRMQQIRQDDRQSHPDWFVNLPEKSVSNRAVLAENASRRVKRYIDNFGRALEEWNKPPPSGGKKSRRPDHIDPAIFKAVVKPLIKEVLEIADRQESCHTHGTYFVRGESEAFCDGDGLFRCMCGGEDVGCQQRFSLNPYDSLSELMLIEAFRIDHRVSQNGLARYVYNTATTVYNSSGRLKFNPDFFYQMLCTRRNFLFVHSSHHNRRRHPDVIDDNEALIPV